MARRRPPLRSLLMLGASDSIPAPVATADFSAITESSLPAWLDYSGITGNRMYYDSTGVLTWAPANMLLNSATLSTQSVTTLAQKYLLSFYGTGSIVCSGTNSTTTNGTGANNRVYSVITCTSGTLTLTVSGSVTSAQLEPVSYQTTPRSYIQTAGSAIYLPRLEYEPTSSPTTLIGVRQEESRSNLLTNSDFANGISDAPARGGNVSATTFSHLPSNTGLAINNTGSVTSYAYKTNNTTSIGTVYTFSIFVKMTDGNAPVFGSSTAANSGNSFALVIAVNPINPLTYVVKHLGSGVYRVSTTITAPNASTNTGVIKYATNDSRSFSVSGYMLEIGSGATSYIPTTSASVTRSADLLTLSGVALQAAGASSGSAIVQTTSWINATASSRDLLSTSTSRRLLYSNSSNTAISSTDGATRLDATIGSSGTFTGGVVRSAVSWGALGRSIAANNGNLSSDSTLLGTGATVTVGGYSTTTTFNGWITSIAIYSTRLSNEALKSKSYVGAQY